MKIKVNRKSLSAALKIVAPVANANSSLEILSCLLIETLDSNAIRVSATDLNQYVSIEFSANVLLEGSIVVDAKVITEIAGKMSGDMLSISSKSEKLNNQAVIVSSGKSMIQLSSLVNEVMAEDFPDARSSDHVEFLLGVESSVLGRLIGGLSFSVCKDITRPWLGVISLGMANGELIATTTDGYRITRMVVEAGKGSELISAIPRIVIATLKRSLGFSTGDVSIGGDEDTLLFKMDVEGTKLDMADRCGRLSVSVMTEHGDFPEYGKIRPTGDSVDALVDRSDLLSAMGVSVINGDKTSLIRIVFSSGEVMVEANRSSLGSGHSCIDAEYDGEQFEYLVNAKYLYEPLKAMECDAVVIETRTTWDKSGPVPIVVRSPDRSFECVIMPIVA